VKENNGIASACLHYIASQATSKYNNQRIEKATRGTTEGIENGQQRRRKAGGRAAGGALCGRWRTRNMRRLASARMAKTKNIKRQGRETRRGAHRKRRAAWAVRVGRSGNASAITSSRDGREIDASAKRTASGGELAAAATASIGNAYDYRRGNIGHESENFKDLCNAYKAANIIIRRKAK
jgi:hypothetical protein